ncbi:TetR/AcrR family transcriptional regulator [Streptomyces sp. NBC_01497]|uniref:TetR/AcrR family transcriptional regulator n=1 Tax=Streptomyces sp. NBC_01497 TaxID=2903885 RepID=UPI002E302044|nr:TetR/AcrR family transcriptional regulator [Streptomyces sp. NBC_01497]
MPRELTAKGLATRSRIVERASVVVCERGVANASLESIREAAGVSSSQLFHYFPEGKRALMLAVARYAADAVIADQEPYLSRLTTWRAWDEWADAVFERFTQRGRTDLSALPRLLEQDSPEMREILAVAYSRWEERLAQGVRALQAAGKVRADLDALATATTMLACVQGAVLMSQATGDTGRLRTALHTAIDQLRH